MNSHERVLKAMSFEKPDRMPLCNHFMPEFTDKWRKYMDFTEDISPHNHYGIDVEIAVADESFFPSQKKILSNDGIFEISNDGWGRIVKHGKRDTFFEETIDTVLKDTVNLDKLNFESSKSEARYHGLQQQAETAGKKGKCLFSKIGGIYVRSHFIRPEDMLLMDMAMDEKFCDELFDRVAAHLTEMALETLARTGTWESGLWIFDDMASSKAPMFSPSMYERYFLPRYKKLIETVKKAGCKHVILHSDGNIGPVLELAMEAGFEGFNPLEPRCGLDLLKLREKYERMLFFGGICNTLILPGGDKREIENHVRPLIELGKNGGTILGSASIGGDITPEAYDFYISLVRKYGNY